MKHHGYLTPAEVRKGIMGRCITEDNLKRDTLRQVKAKARQARNAGYLMDELLRKEERK